MSLFSKFKNNLQKTSNFLSSNILSSFQNKKVEVFNQLPEGIRNIILKSKELEGTEKQDLGDENNAQDLGDIPF